MLYRIKGVDGDKCNGCEKCAQVCHNSCFDMIESGGSIIASFAGKDKCDSCGDCIIVCFFEGEAIILEPLKKDKSGYVEKIDGNKCDACGKCINLCPGKNIEIVEEKGRIFARIIDPKKCVADGHCSFCCNVDDKIYVKNK